MKKLALLVCLLVATVAAQAQFEKGKWILNPSISGLGLSHNTETDKTSFGIEAKGGAFLLDNVALLIHEEPNGMKKEVIRMFIHSVWAVVTISVRLVYIWVLMST